MLKLARGRSGAVAATVAVALASLGSEARAETESIFQSVGMDTSLVFPHALSGTSSMDISFFGFVDGGPRTMPPWTGPTSESHILVTVFEWGPTATGPWTASPDNVNSIPVEMGTFISTGVFNAPEEAPFVRIHWYAGNLMTVSGTFTHVSVPEPSALCLAVGGLALVTPRRRFRRRSYQ